LKQFSTRQVTALALSVAILGAVLFVDIDGEVKVLALSLLAGVLIGVVMFLRQTWDGSIPDSAGERLTPVMIGSLQIRGGIGAGIIILALVIALLIELPVLRWIALPGVFIGLAFGGFLVLWRRHQGE
jgi:hypothetical protein